jgi:hypothetical protein
VSATPVSVPEPGHASAIQSSPPPVDAQYPPPPIPAAEDLHEISSAQVRLIDGDGAAHAPAKAGLLAALRSEWIKTRSTPSTMWSLLVATVLAVGLGAVIAWATAQSYQKGTDLKVRLEWDPTAISTSGLALAVLVVGVLGALMIASEYSTKSIGTTLAAVPKRYRVLTAKGAVLVGITMVLFEVLAFVTFFIGQAVISGHAPTATLSDPGVLRALVGCGLSGALLALLGLCLGAIFRSAAAAIATLVAVLYVLPALAQLLPTSIANAINKWWPTQAAQQITNVHQQANTLSPWAGLGVMVVFTAVLFTVALWQLDVRDA